MLNFPFLFQQQQVTGHAKNKGKKKSGKAVNGVNENDKETQAKPNEQPNSRLDDDWQRRDDEARNTVFIV